MKAPDEKELDHLIKGKIRQPSPRFEEALQRIPTSEDRGSTHWWITSWRPLAIAASLILGLFIIMNPEFDERGTDEKDPHFATSLNEDWIELFSLANSLESATSLTDSETRLALEYYAFNQ